MFSANREKKRGLHSANMTPLIDVSLVLVVMLMLLTPLAFESSIILRKGEKGLEKQEGMEDQKVRIAIVSEDSLKVEGKDVSREDLGNVLEPVFRRRGYGRVEITCRGEVSHGAFVNVIDQARLSGAAGISVREGSR